MKALLQNAIVKRTELPMLRRTLFVVGYAIAHWGGSVFATFAAYGASMQGFEGGLDASPIRRTVTSALVELFHWPLSLVVKRFSSPGVLGHIWIFANGVVWGVVLLCGVGLARHAWIMRQAASCRRSVTDADGLEAAATPPRSIEVPAAQPVVSQTNADQSSVQ